MSKQLLTSLDSIESEAKNLHTALRGGKVLRKRKNVLTRLENLSTIVESGITTSKKTRKKPRSLSKTLVALNNTIMAIHNGIDQQELSLTETRNIYSTKVMQRIRFISEASDSFRSRVETEEKIEERANKAWEDAKDEQIRIEKAAKGSKAEREQAQKLAEDHGISLKKALSLAANAVAEEEEVRQEEEIKLELDLQKKSSKKLQAYKKFEENLLSSKKDKAYKLMVQNGTTLPTTCPVFVSFTKGRLRERSVLEELGFEFTFISTRNSDVADVALIMENQVLLQFSKKAALVFYENKVQAMKEKVNNSGDNKLLRTKRKQLKELVAKQTRLEASMEKQSKEGSRKVVKASLDSVNEKIELLEVDVARLQSNIKNERHKITLYGREIFKRSVLVDEATGRKRYMLKEKAYELYINHILDEFHANGHHYSMLSSQFESHPNIADVQLAWLVPSSVTQVVRSLYGDQQIVANWGLPWKAHG